MTAATHTPVETIFADPTQNAKLDMLLVTDSGMRSKTKARVSVAQWGAICIAANSHADALVCLAGSELLEALAEARLSIECAAGCDEGVGEEVAYSEILSFGGSSLASAYSKVVAAIAKATGQ